MNTFGDRLSRARRIRVMTQSQLAESVGCNTETVSQLERNVYGDPSLMLLCKLAENLRITVSYLLDERTGETVIEQDKALLLQIRRLLLTDATIGDSVDGSVSTYQEQKRQLLSLTELFDNMRYGEVVESLPSLVIAIETAITTTREGDFTKWESMLAHAYLLVAQTLVHLRSEDLAIFATKKAVAAADAAEDSVLRASVGTTSAWAFIRQGLYADARDSAIRSADMIVPDMKVTETKRLAVYGRLYMEAARAAAYAGSESEARDLMRLAHSVAVRIPEEEKSFETYWSIFNVAAIGIGSTSNAVTLGDADLALSIARNVPRMPGIHKDLWSAHLLDVGEAHMMRGDSRNALESVKSIFDSAPQWLTQNRDGHDLVRRLLLAVPVRQVRASGLANVATAMGVQP